MGELTGSPTQTITRHNTTMITLTTNQAMKAVVAFSFQAQFGEAPPVVHFIDFLDIGEDLQTINDFVLKEYAYQLALKRYVQYEVFIGDQNIHYSIRFITNGYSYNHSVAVNLLDTEYLWANCTEEEQIAAIDDYAYDLITENIIHMEWDILAD